MSEEKKPANLFVVSLGEQLNGIPPSLRGKLVMWPCGIPVAVVQSNFKTSKLSMAHTHEAYPHQEFVIKIVYNMQTVYIFLN